MVYLLILIIILLIWLIHCINLGNKYIYKITQLIFTHVKEINSKINKQKLN